MNFSTTEIVPPANNCDIVNVGAWLKEAREAKGETLDEVSSVTRIGKDYLEAIEAGTAAKLPSQAYTRGFIRLYATHLGLSADTALAMIEQNQAATSPCKPAPLPAQQKIKPNPAYRRTITLITVLTLTLASGYILLKSKKPDKIQQDVSRVDPAQQYNAEKLPEKTHEQASPREQPLTAPAPQQANGENVRPEGIVLRLKAVNDGKVHVTIDGSVSQEYDLVTGDLVEWKAERVFTLDLENAASVEGELDGKPLKPFGVKGKSTHLLIRQDGIHSE